MFRTSVVVIGAGQAGLAISHFLSTAGVDHVVLERGRTAAAWDGHTWPSLRLLTPNWLSRLPGYAYSGPDAAGYMRAPEVADYLRGYAAYSGAPVREGVEVLSLREQAGGYRVVTTAGVWSAREVVVATGWCAQPYVPPVASGLDPRLTQVTPSDYAGPGSIPDGGVLVVGASATGVQLADELVESGRRVALSVGSHARLPRHYRGLDICWWLDAMGTLARRIADHPTPESARREPSLQLAGRTDGRDMDLAALQDRGVGLLGRLAGASGRWTRFAADLGETCTHGEQRMQAVLERIDAFAETTGLSAEIGSAERLRQVNTSGSLDRLDLVRAGIRTVVWATGYRRAYPWLRVPVLDSRGEIEHHEGTTASPGLHVVGMRWQTRRDSSFLDGVRHDAAIVSGRILAQLGAPELARSAA